MGSPFNIASNVFDGCVQLRIALRFEILDGHDNDDIGRQTNVIDGALVRREPFGNRHTRRALIVRKRHPVLHEPLP